jgi:hypothetical protein
VQPSVNLQQVSGSHVILTRHPERGTSEGSRLPLQAEISFDMAA